MDAYIRGLLLGLLLGLFVAKGEGEAMVVLLQERGEVPGEPGLSLRPSF